MNAAIPPGPPAAPPKFLSKIPFDFEEELRQWHAKGLGRRLVPVRSASGRLLRRGSGTFLNFASNDYLGLAHHPRLCGAACRAILRWGTGSGASRLLSGNLLLHEELERRIAQFKKEETALVFSSGYLANLGAVTAVASRGDLVLLDRLNHASLIDAARLSGAAWRVYPHADPAALDRILSRAGGFRRRLVVTDAYFSMDGDVAPLDRLVEVCQKRGALLMVDEAHSTGVFGRRGAGLTERFGLEGRIPIVMGTLSKALGSVGGYLSGAATLRDLFVNRARMFIYTTAPSPAASAAALEAIRLVPRMGEVRRRYAKRVHLLRETLIGLGFDLLRSEGPILPLCVGDTRRVVRLQERLAREGIFAPAIRPPTVPKGTDRIRLSVSAAHTDADLHRLAAVLKKSRKGIC